LNQRTLELFHMEIARQCNFALFAEADLRQYLQQLTPPPNFTDSDIRAILSQGAVLIDRFWYSAHALLSATANISKILWPSNQSTRSQEDARQIRAGLGIDDTSPLKNRRMRDHFEHFDERIERFAQSDVNYVDTGIGHRLVHSDPPAVHMRNFDPEENSITFQNETLLLGPTMEAIHNTYGEDPDP